MVVFTYISFKIDKRKLPQTNVNKQFIKFQKSMWYINFSILYTKIHFIPRIDINIQFFNRELKYLTHFLLDAICNENIDVSH